MTISEFNHEFYPALNRARSFINCINNALEKSGESAAKQMEIIGWSDETRGVLLDALMCLENETRDGLRFGS